VPFNIIFGLFIRQYAPTHPAEVALSQPRRVFVRIRSCTKNANLKERWTTVFLKMTIILQNLHGRGGGVGKWEEIGSAT
jgi:hypothetical protein